MVIEERFIANVPVYRLWDFLLDARSIVTVLGRLDRFGEGIMRRKAKEVGEQFARAVKERLETASSDS